MPRCEDYPCCGHGPPPMGDGGGCPTVSEKSEKCPNCVDGCEECDYTGVIYTTETLWNCVDCGRLFKPTNSSLCPSCYRRVGREGYFVDENDPGDGYAYYTY